MKRFLVIILTGIAVALGTAGSAQAHDRYYRSSHYSRGYSSGYCAPRYYSSYGYGGYCAPRYYGSGISIGLPGIGIHLGRY